MVTNTEGITIEMTGIIILGTCMISHTTKRVMAHLIGNKATDTIRMFIQITEVEATLQIYIRIDWTTSVITILENKAWNRLQSGNDNSYYVKNDSNVPSSSTGPAVQSKIGMPGLSGLRSFITNEVVSFTAQQV